MRVTKTAMILVLFFSCGRFGGTTASGAEGGSAAELTRQGWVHWQKQEMTEAIASFEQAVKLDPKTKPLNGLGWANMNSGNTAEAKKAFERLVAVNPRHPAALNGLGQLYLAKEIRQGRNLPAEAAPQAPAAWHGLARLSAPRQVRQGRKMGAAGRQLRPSGRHRQGNAPGRQEQTRYRRSPADDRAARGRR